MPLRRFRKTRKASKGKHQLLIYADDVNVYGETEGFVVASNELGLEVNDDEI
jgi:hypothetical protein